MFADLDRRTQQSRVCQDAALAMAHKVDVLPNFDQMAQQSRDFRDRPCRVGRSRKLWKARGQKFMTSQTTPSLSRTPRHRTTAKPALIGMIHSQATQRGGITGMLPARAVEVAASPTATGTASTSSGDEATRARREPCSTRRSCLEPDRRGKHVHRNATARATTNPPTQPTNAGKSSAISGADSPLVGSSGYAVRSIIPVSATPRTLSPEAHPV